MATASRESWRPGSRWGLTADCVLSAAVVAVTAAFGYWHGLFATITASALALALLISFPAALVMVIGPKYLGYVPERVRGSF